VPPLKPGYNSQQRRFAGPAFTENGQELAVRDIERYFIEHSCAAEAFTDSGDG
jgi:hypothetical protein